MTQKSFAEVLHRKLAAQIYKTIQHFSQCKLLENAAFTYVLRMFFFAAHECTKILHISPGQTIKIVSDDWLQTQARLSLIHCGHASSNSSSVVKANWARYLLKRNTPHLVLLIPLLVHPFVSGPRSYRKTDENWIVGRRKWDTHPIMPVDYIRQM